MYALSRIGVHPPMLSFLVEEEREYDNDIDT